MTVNLAPTRIAPPTHGRIEPHAGEIERRANPRVTIEHEHARAKLSVRWDGIRDAITQHRTRSAQPEEGVEITEPENDGESVEDNGSPPQWPGVGGANGERVGVPRKERGAPPIPRDGHFRVARLRGLGVVKDAVAVPLQPQPGILVDQLEPPVGPVAHVDVLEVGRITAGVGIAAAHFRSCDEAGSPCWTGVFPSKPEGDTHC